MFSSENMKGGSGECRFHTTQYIHRPSGRIEHFSNKYVICGKLVENDAIYASCAHTSNFVPRRGRRVVYRINFPVNEHIDHGRAMNQSRPRKCSLFPPL